MRPDGVFEQAPQRLPCAVVCLSEDFVLYLRSARGCVEVQNPKQERWGIQWRINARTKYFVELAYKNRGEGVPFLLDVETIANLFPNLDILYAAAKRNDTFQRPHKMSAFPNFLIDISRRDFAIDGEEINQIQFTRSAYAPFMRSNRGRLPRNFRHRRLGKPD